MAKAERDPNQEQYCRNRRGRNHQGVGLSTGEPRDDGEVQKYSVYRKKTYTLQGINISHLGKRKLIFKMPFWGDMLVPWRVVGFCWVFSRYSLEPPVYCQWTCYHFCGSNCSSGGFFGGGFVFAFSAPCFHLGSFISIVANQLICWISHHQFTCFFHSHPRWCRTLSTVWPARVTTGGVELRIHKYGWISSSLWMDFTIAMEFIIAMNRKSPQKNPIQIPSMRCSSHIWLIKFFWHASR